MKQVIRTTKLTVHPETEPLFSEFAFNVEIVDEAAGEFVQVEQFGAQPAKILIEPEEWPALRRAINKMIRECRKETRK